MKKTVYYPRLRQYMAKHGITIDDLSEVIKKGYRQTWSTRS